MKHHLVLPLIAASATEWVSVRSAPPCPVTVTWDAAPGIGTPLPDSELTTTQDPSSSEDEQAPPHYPIWG